jgi:hypothetical protein
MQYQEINKTRYPKVFSQHLAEGADFCLFSKEIIHAVLHTEAKYANCNLGINIKKLFLLF